VLFIDYTVVSAVYIRKQIGFSLRSLKLVVYATKKYKVCNSEESMENRERTNGKYSRKVLLRAGLLIYYVNASDLKLY